MAADTPARSLGGRFSEPTDPLLHEINQSVHVDHVLWRYDIRGSRAHAAMLAEVGLITAADGAAITEGLDAVERELASGDFQWLEGDEDVHMAIERRLVELVGEPGRRLHTGRSRNDQVMTDTLLWLRAAVCELRGVVVALGTTMLNRAESAAGMVMPSFTHLQPAQVSSVGHWLCAHAAEMQRHVRRLDHLAERLDECPLGSGASAGSYLPIDRRSTALALGFSRPTVNSVQTTGSRADLLDAMAITGMIGVSVSRLGEELVLFASPAFSWIRLPDGLTTGSSLLPQKRNPDGAELLRAGGKLPAQEFAALASVSAGLVSGYSKDLQHDKELLFGAFRRVTRLVALADRHVERLVWNDARMRAACTPDLAALWLADRLVIAGMPFRQAHHVVGAAARDASDRGVPLADAFAVLPGDIVDHEVIAMELSAMTPDTLLTGLRSEGGAGRVAEQIAELRLRFSAPGSSQGA